MPATYEPIASTTLGSATASYTFSSIPGTYTDLVLVVTHRNDNGTFGGDLAMRFNSDTGTNYSETYLYGNGTAASSGRIANFSRLLWGRAVASNAAAGNFSANVANIQSYANTSVFTTVLSSGASAAADLVRRVGLWRSTAAITSITIYDEAGANMAAGCVLSIYGIKAA